ncbi:GntR family transcriptional regulator|uniref:GntR family transcriptional regulator n=1 Tax=Noviherbaspirillum sp. L7-7A TaxID=2850560 RepID=UPI001C2BB43C|nr:GntR family transcriptional regulator [Noviherbaspirillum sp. L7-7A]MBV0880224.1 GntR family transcriptional regulator [Noviherbaspirillum sp. L7-7A]
MAANAWRHAPANAANDSPATLGDAAYLRLKDELFAFRLLPGERFSETAMAARLGMSRTPLRQALARLQREGYLDMDAKSGWSVRLLDFEQFDHLYDLRLVLETAVVRRLCEDGALHGALYTLSDFWLVAPEARLDDGQRVAEMDEAFHMALVAAAANPEMARVHHDVTERIRILRRLDFSSAGRVACTYDEHGAILRAILARQADQAAVLLREHVEASKTKVRNITLHRLYTARDQRR